MKQVFLARCAALAVTALLLAACSKGGDDDNAADDAKGVALVTTAMPVQQSFHDSVAAWGRSSVLSSPA